MAQGVHTQKAFIPYVPGAFINCPAGSGTVLQARVTTIDSNAVQLDREVTLDGVLVDFIPFSYLVWALLPFRIHSTLTMT